MAKDKKTVLGDDIESVEKTELAESKKKKLSKPVWLEKTDVGNGQH